MRLCARSRDGLEQRKVQQRRPLAARQRLEAQRQVAPGLERRVLAVAGAPAPTLGLRPPAWPRCPFWSIGVPVAQERALTPAVLVHQQAIQGRVADAASPCSAHGKSSASASWIQGTNATCWASQSQPWSLGGVAGPRSRACRALRQRLQVAVGRQRQRGTLPQHFVRLPRPGIGVARLVGQDVVEARRRGRAAPASASACSDQRAELRGPARGPRQQAHRRPLVGQPIDQGLALQVGALDQGVEQRPTERLSPLLILLPVVAWACARCRRLRSAARLGTSR